MPLPLPCRISEKAVKSFSRCYPKEWRTTKWIARSKQYCWGRISRSENATALFPMALWISDEARVGGRFGRFVPSG